jgi:predicted nucleic acid-binding protein
MIISDVHIFEVKDIKDLEERDQLTLLLNGLGKRQPFDGQALRQRANLLVSKKLGLGDAAHIAFADAAEADFVSVDDRLLKQCRRVKVPIWFGSPLAYCDKENLK